MVNKKSRNLDVEIRFRLKLSCLWSAVSPKR